MDLIADALLLAGALTAAVYCWVLSRRVKSLNDLDAGLGSAIASLSAQVNDMQSTLKSAQIATGASASEMEELADRAERAAENLKLMLATVQEDKEERPKRSARVRKFPKPKPKEAVQRVETPVEEFIDAPEPIDPEFEDPPIRKVKPKQTAAQKLQKDIVSKIEKRDDDVSREELVQALQSILAASK